MQGKHSLDQKRSLLAYLFRETKHNLVQVFWPLDADWYAGRVLGYNSETNRHHVWISYLPHFIFLLSSPNLMIWIV